MVDVAEAHAALVTRFVAEQPEAERDDTDALLIVMLLCSGKSVTARDVASVVQRSEQATEAVLRRLASGEAQLLEPTAGTSATVQRLFDVDVYRARVMLRDFGGREILVRISTQTRGPKVKSGPDPSFPAERRGTRR